MERIRKKPAPAKPPVAPPDDSLASDLLDGVREMADFLGWTVRQVYHGIAINAIPHERRGRRIIGSKTVLRRRYQGGQS
jgi:hypothetical protein